MKQETEIWEAQRQLQELYPGCKVTRVSCTLYDGQERAFWDGEITRTKKAECACCHKDKEIIVATAVCASSFEDLVERLALSAAKGGVL